MKHIIKNLPFNGKEKLTNELLLENTIFFDIETTGFSPAFSNIYLIGCLRRCGNELIIDQFFAESKNDEIFVLENFCALLEQFQTVVTFNGLGFDLPFIKSKCISYGISFDFDKFEYLDIFKEVNKLKRLLKLPNYKQKTIEQFLGVDREDIYSGGELISVYENYLISHEPKAEEILLLHNYEDVLGMLDLIPILSYLRILNGGFILKEYEISSYTLYDKTKGEELFLTMENSYTAPKDISFQCENFYLVIRKNITKIRIPILYDELKYFYENSKDYYYLPIEDCAIHKSVAAFVDKEFRQKAKAQNCYTRKTSKFLPQYSSLFTPSFRKNFKDKISYFELTDSFISDDKNLIEYIMHLFQQNFQ